MSKHELERRPQDAQKESATLPYWIHDIFENAQSSGLDVNKVKLGSVHYSLSELDERALNWLKSDENGIFGEYDDMYAQRGRHMLDMNLSWESTTNGLPEDISSRLINFREGLKSMDILDPQAHASWKEMRDWTLEQFTTREELSDAVRYFADHRDLLLPEKEKPVRHRPSY